MQLQAQTTLKRLFADPDVTFAVPSFQRAYSWEKDKQVQQFITDLRDQPKKKPYFLGHFLFEQEQLNGNHFLVIDGQQRLTTAVLFFSALCKELEKRMSSGEEINDSDGQPIDLSEVRNIFLQRRGKQKLTAVANDNPFFQAAFLQQQDNRKPSLDSRSQKRMADAYSLFAETMSLTGNSKGLTTSELLHWKQLLENSVITTFVVTDKVQATQLFAFQNDRGKDLTTLEKLKAFLMYRAYLADDTTNDNKTLSLVEGYFAQIYTISERLRMLKEDQVLSHHNIAFGSTWENAFDNAKDGVIKAGSDAVTWVINYCEALHRTFQEVENIEHLANGTSHVADLLYLDAANSWPLIIKINYFHAGDRNLTESLYRLMEKILFKLNYSWADYRTNYFHGWAKNYIGKSEALTSALDEAAKSGFKSYWTFTKSFVDRLNSDHHYVALTRYLLWKYENHLRMKEKRQILTASEFRNEFGSVSWNSTLDHISPQNPDDSYTEEEFKDKWLDNVGNLALLTHGGNAREGNKVPIDKYEAYLKSGHVSNIEIAAVLKEKKQWAESEIEARKKRIVDFALEYWKAD